MSMGQRQRSAFFGAAIWTEYFSSGYSFTELQLLDLEKRLVAALSVHLVFFLSRDPGGQKRKKKTISLKILDFSLNIQKDQISYWARSRENADAALSSFAMKDIWPYISSFAQSTYERAECILWYAK